MSGGILLTGKQEDAAGTRHFDYVTTELAATPTDFRSLTHPLVHPLTTTLSLYRLIILHDPTAVCIKLTNL